MTLLTTEGFETRAVKDGWTFSSAAFVAGRFGGTAMSSGSALFSMPAATDVAIVGGAIQLPAAASSRDVYLFHDGAGGANAQIRVTLRADKYIDILRGFTVIASSAAPVGAGGDWVWLEAKARLNDVTGLTEVRANGAVVVSYVGDTVNTTTAGLNTGVTMITVNGLGTSLTDDVYVCNDLGAAPYNTYLGECQVETLIPNGNGAASQLVGSDGNSVDNYLLVDELPAVDADRVESSTTGQRDLYLFTDPAAGVGEVLAVMPCVAVSKIIPGPCTVKVIDRLAVGTERISASKNVLNLGWRTAGPYVADAAGAAWTPASVTAAQFGVEVG